MSTTEELEQAKADAQILANAFYDAQKDLAALRQVSAYVFPLLGLAMSAGKITASEARWIFMDIERADSELISPALTHETLKAVSEGEGLSAIPEMYTSHAYWNSQAPKTDGDAPPVPIFDESNPAWSVLWKAYSRHVTEGCKK